MLALLACVPYGPFPDWGVTDPTAERIAVTPAEIDFHTISVNGPGATTATFRITNLGEEPVTVTGQDEPVGAEVFAVDAEPFLNLDPGVTREVSVTFAPPTEGAWNAKLVIAPGDEGVRLSGGGTAPVLTVEGSDFDAVVLGCQGVGTVTLGNDGSEALVFQGASVGSEEFAVLDLPAEIAPGDTGVIEVQFTPAGGGSRSTNLLVDTNDPLHPQSSIPLSVLGYEGEKVEESFRYTPSNPTDLLFVVDRGDSMEGLMAPAPAGVDAFVEQLRSTNIDYHLAALSSGSVCPGSTPGWASRTDTSLQTEAALEQGLSGPGGDWDDALLALALLALDDDAGCLEGFRRDDADLHVIAITDGPAPPDLATRVTELATRAPGFRLSAMIPLTSTCGLVLDRWRDEVDTTGGVAGDLCSEDWATPFTEFATLPPGADPVSYPLAEVPVASSIEVTVEDVPLAAWTYDPYTNNVRFDGDAVPALGAEVGIRYVQAVACEAGG